MLNKPKRKRKKSNRLPEELAHQVLERDNGLCVLCGKYGVELHHINYGASGRVHTLENLVCLCPNCHHNIVHRNKKKYKPILEDYINGLQSKWFETD